MEEKIFLKLQAGLKNSSLTEKSIRAIAAFKAKTIKEESEITDAFIADGIELGNKLDGQISFQVAEIVRKQTDKLPIPPVTPTTDVPDETQKKINEMIDKLSVMEQNFQNSQKQVKLQSIRNEAAKLLRAKKADKDYILENTLAKVEVADGDTAESLAEKCIPIYDTEFKKAYGEGSVPRGGENTPPAPDATKLEEFKKSKGIGIEAKK